MLYGFQVEYMCLRISFTNLFLKDVHIHKQIPWSRILNLVAMFCSQIKISPLMFLSFPCSYTGAFRLQQYPWAIIALYIGNYKYVISVWRVLFMCFLCTVNICHGHNIWLHLRIEHIISYKFTRLITFNNTHAHFTKHMYTLQNIACTLCTTCMAPSTFGKVKISIKKLNGSNNSNFINYHHQCIYLIT